MKKIGLLLLIGLIGGLIVSILKIPRVTKARFLPAVSNAETERTTRFKALIDRALETNEVMVILRLRTEFKPEGLMAKGDISRQRDAIRLAQDDFLNRYQHLRTEGVKKFEYIPFLALKTNAGDLSRLQLDPEILSIEEDVVGDPALAESTQIVGAPAAWSSGYTGTGQMVAILDSGVDKNHEFLSPRVTSEACFSTTNASSTSFCPGGATSSTDPNSGLHCSNSISGCAHGTNVAGIAAGKGTGFSGVAKDSNIIAIQMFSEFLCSGLPCARYWTSDLIRALEHVRTLADSNPNIAAVNLSLQTGQQFISNCDVSHSATKSAIDNLRSVNVPTVICSGNFSFTNALTAPACISTSISVGATDDGSLGTSIDQVASFSDSSPLLHLLAPGRWINSSIPGNAYENYSGTSMAAPHVVGAMALLRQKRPNAPIDRMVNSLINSGKPILDTRNNITKPRIKIPEALAALTPSKFDFDGDDKTDVSIFRPAPGEWWYLKSSDGGNRAFQFGTSADQVVPADYTGDGRSDVAFWRQSSGEWFILRSEDNSFYSFPFGTGGDIPAPGDFDGDGKDDPAIFRPTNQTWYILNSSGTTTIASFGASGDRPVPADYDGDGKTDLAIFRPSDGTWWLNRTTSGLVVYNFGSGTDKTVPDDYTGDGRADVAFFRPSSSEWFILRSEDTSFYSFPFGSSGDIPTPGDYDGDGKFDPAVFRPSNNTWYKFHSTNGFQAVTFGLTNDIPLPGAFVR